MDFPPYIYHLVTPEVQWKASVFSVLMCEDVLGIQICPSGNFGHQKLTLFPYPWGPKESFDRNLRNVLEVFDPAADGILFSEGWQSLWIADVQTKFEAD